jgi:Type IV secretion-system coupling protein DNA-binding domain
MMGAALSGAAALTHGWSGVALVYSTVQIAMLAGLARGRAQFHHYFLSPSVAAPLAALAGVGMAVASPWLHGLGMAPQSLLRAGIGVAVGAALGYSSGRFTAAGTSTAGALQRGAVVEERPVPAQSGRQRKRESEGAITLAGMAVPAQDEAKHFKVIGTTGTGKSIAIREILQAALARGDRAVIADPDGGYLREFYDARRGDVVLNPLEKNSRRWDLFREIESSNDIDELALSLIPDQDGGDHSWTGYARTFFSAVTRQAHAAGMTDVGDLFHLLAVADVQELRTLVRGTPAQPFLDEHNLRMFDSIRSVTISAVKSLEYVAQQEAQPLSVRQWVRGNAPGVLFIPYRAGQIAALRSPISAWMRLAIFETMNRDESEFAVAVKERARAGGKPPARDSGRLWFVVDELDALGKIDGLKDALARLRKFGGRCVLGFQSISQVSGTYGRHEAHTIVENCGNSLILRCSASDGGGTARFASQLIGDREVLRKTVSTSRRSGEWVGSTTLSEHYNIEPALLPSQIEQLPDLAGYLKHASGAKWRRVTLSPGRVDSKSLNRSRDAAPGWAAGTPATLAADRGDIASSLRGAGISAAIIGSPPRMAGGVARGIAGSEARTSAGSAVSIASGRAVDFKGRTSVLDASHARDGWDYE